MNRRDFLTIGVRAAAGLAALTIIPAPLLAKEKLIPFDFTEDITYQVDRAAWFYCANANIYGVEYYAGIYIDDKSDRELKYAREQAKIAFKNRAKRLI